MATKIIHKKSSVASSIPSAGDLEPGEIAVNLADQKLYSKTTGGTVIELAPNDDQLALTENCKNVSGGSLAIGTPVYQSGTAGNAMEVQKALSGTAASMPAVGLLSSTLADEAEGTIVLSGFLQGLDTSAFSEGDTLYVSTTGTLTTTTPTGEANLIQNIGKVVKVHASNGSIVVTGAGRANATPNLDEGKIFIGDASNQAVTEDLNDLIDVHLNTSTATNDQVLSWDGSDYAWTSAGGAAAPAITTDGSTPSLASGITDAEVRSLIGAGTSSSDNATHTGEVTGSDALTIASDVVDADNLAVTGNGTTSQYLRSDGDGTFTWDTPSSGQSTSHGAVGTYASFSCTVDNISIGSTTAGSNLRRKNDEGDGFGTITGTGSTSTASGTWRVMGNHRTLVSSSQSGTVYYANLFVRIS